MSDKCYDIYLEYPTTYFGPLVYDTENIKQVGGRTRESLKECIDSH